MDNFTPLQASLGGALIGLAAVLLMVLNGRIAGISGIVHGAFRAPVGERLWRLLFIAGLVCAPLAWQALSGMQPKFQVTEQPALLVTGGLLVGFGTRLGSGCTSGHGVCGVSRLSPRSLVAVVTFMAAGMVTVALAKTAMGA